MLIDAILMLVFQVTSLESALKSINLDVIGILFGMFSIVTALDRAGVLKLIAIRLLNVAMFVITSALWSSSSINDYVLHPFCQS